MRYNQDAEIEKLLSAVRSYLYRTRRSRDPLRARKGDAMRECTAVAWHFESVLSTS
jgi:hypothetical protein